MNEVKMNVPVTCDRCHRECTSEMLRIDVAPTAGVDTTERCDLCPRCALMLLALLGGARHIIAVMPEDVDIDEVDLIVDAVGLTSAFLAKIKDRFAGLEEKLS